ncbi:sugar-binding domain-containing protein [Chryseolinea sp. T2]|uniref:sugar-binding domain-containing protein n=1 Tax=Chryseolinea sp. T2 TaxID=3129255 RepID=UPI00307748AA
MSRFIVAMLVFALTGCDPGEDTRVQRAQYTFSPLSGVVNSEELPFRSELCLNGEWNFMPVYENDLSGFILPKRFDWDSVPIKIPSPWNVNTFSKGHEGTFMTYPSYPEEWEKANIGWMKREFVLPESWNRKMLRIHFEAIAGISKTYINGQLAGENLDLIHPTEIDATNLMHRGKNEIIVGVAKESLSNESGKQSRSQHATGSLWGNYVTGIWQDVHVVATPEMMIENVYVDPDLKTKELTVKATIHNYSNSSHKITGAAVVRSWKKNDADDERFSGCWTLGAEVLNFSASEVIELAAGSSAQLLLRQRVEDQLDLWTPEEPHLYGLTVELDTDGNVPIDRKFVRFAWRQFM